MPHKLTLEAAMIGAINAIKEASPATDAIVIVLDRRTGEFKMAAHPSDTQRNVEVMDKALFRLKRAKGREYRRKSGIIIPTKH